MHNGDNVGMWKENGLRKETKEEKCWANEKNIGITMHNGDNVRMKI